MYLICKRSLLALLWLAIPLPGLADDMLSVYQLAVQSDPQLQAAKAAYQATLEVIPQSRAALLPNIGATGVVTRDRYHNRNPQITDKTTVPPTKQPENSYATNKTFGAQLTQAIYQRESFLKLEQTDSVVAQSKAQLTAAEQDLILRVATRYFLVLGAQDNLEFVKGDKDAIGRTLDQAKQRFDVGLSAITDVLEAQARYDIAVSDEINAEKLLADAREALRELTGVIPGQLGVLQPEIPLNPPDPAVEEQWVTVATDQNPLLLAARAATETARQEIEIQRSGHYPTLDLTADYLWRNNDFGGLGIGQERNDSSIGVQITLPLYQGGLISANTRQSQYQFNQAQENQVQQRRATERQARDYFRGVMTGIGKVSALKQAVLSNEKALEAAEAGFEVGTRTIVDVLDTQRDLLGAKRDHARSRYDYLLDMLRLKQAAGILGEEDLELVNTLLQSPQAVSLKSDSLRKTTPRAEHDRPSNEPVSEHVPGARNSGRWVINLVSYTSETSAKKMLNEIQRLDSMAELFPTTVQDSSVYRVRIAGFETRDDAMQYANTLKETTGIDDFWIARN